MKANWCTFTVIVRTLTMLRQLLVLLCLLSVMGCHPHPTAKVDSIESVAQCIAPLQGQSDYVLVTKCVPLSRPMRLAGTWFVGFEESAFSPGYSKIPAMSDNRAIPMVFSDAAAKTLPTIQDGQRAAYHIAFVGRRTLVKEPMLQRIVVDRLITVKEVPRLPNASEKLADRSNVQQ